MSEELKFYSEDFTQASMNDYKMYCNLYECFAKKLEEISGKSYCYKDVDKFLWFYGKYELLHKKGVEIDIRIY